MKKNKQNCNDDDNLYIFWLGLCYNNNDNDNHINDNGKISVKHEDAEQLYDILLNSEDVKAAGMAAKETLRIESGICEYGRDISNIYTPVQASLSWTIGKRRREDKNFPGSERILHQLHEEETWKKIEQDRYMNEKRKMKMKIFTREFLSFFFKKTGEDTSNVIKYSKNQSHTTDNNRALLDGGKLGNSSGINTVSSIKDLNNIHDVTKPVDIDGKKKTGSPFLIKNSDNVYSSNCSSTNNFCNGKIRETNDFCDDENKMICAHYGKGVLIKRIGIIVEGYSAPKPYDLLLDEDDDIVGWVTSTCFSPSLQKHILMSYVYLPFARAKTPIKVETKNGVQVTKVAKLPFVPPAYYKIPLDCQ